MAELLVDLFLSADGYARGTRSPGYFGLGGPDLGSWISAQMDRPQRQVLGRRTYRLLDSIPEEARDDEGPRMTATPTIVFSRTLDSVTWPKATVCANDVTDEVRTLKRGGGDDLRTIGSLSLARQLLTAGLVDRLRLMVFPLLVGESGQEPAFAGMPDVALDLADHAILDGGIACYDYRPAGPPPYVG